MSRKAIAHELGLSDGQIGRLRVKLKLETRRFVWFGKLAVYLDEPTYRRVTAAATARRMNMSRFLRLLIAKGLTDV